MIRLMRTANLLLARSIKLPHVMGSLSVYNSALKDPIVVVNVATLGDDMAMSAEMLYDKVEYLGRAESEDSAVTLPEFFGSNELHQVSERCRF
jgi:hypothetical protein